MYDDLPTNNSNFYQDLLFLETSARTGEGVEDAFFKCAKMISSRIEAGRINPEALGSGIQTGSGRKLQQPTSGNSNTEGGCAC